MLSTDFERIWRDYNRALRGMTDVGTVFVLGPQRSGTTWVQLLLDAHPECACRFELRLHDTLMAGMHQMVGTYNALISAIRSMCRPGPRPRPACSTRRT